MLNKMGIYALYVPFLRYVPCVKIFYNNFFHRPRYQAADDYSAHNLITGHGCTTGKGVKEKSVVLSEDDTCQ